MNRINNNRHSHPGNKGNVNNANKVEFLCLATIVVINACVPPSLATRMYLSPQQYEQYSQEENGG